jgi:hypothetical protein
MEIQQGLKSAPEPPSEQRPRSGHRWPKILLWPLRQVLRTRDPRDTVDRLFESRHVNDLRLIAATAFVAAELVFVVSLVLAVFFCIDAWGDHPPHSVSQRVVFLAGYGGGPFIRLFGPTLVLLGAILAWAYQMGSARLGVVDLFACEIDTLCRVVTVTEATGTLSRRFDAAGAPFEAGSSNRATAEGAKSAQNGMPGTGTTSPAGPGPSVQSVSQGSVFSSAENYFPILENNSRDLQNLEADVVTNITAFYTFMKTVRDMLRKLSDPEASKSKDDANNLLYMLYLALESGRKSMDDLVEFEPAHTERTVVILLSELPAYEFLRRHYATEGESHHERLIVRGPIYVRLMRRLERVLNDKRKTFLPIMTERLTEEDLSYEETQWWLALQLLPSLEKRYRVLDDHFPLGCQVEGDRIMPVQAPSVIIERKSSLNAVPVHTEATFFRRLLTRLIGGKLSESSPAR